jgi:hypothetical protein
MMVVGMVVVMIVDLLVVRVMWLGGGGMVVGVVGLVGVVRRLG